MGEAVAVLGVSFGLALIAWAAYRLLPIRVRPAPSGRARKRPPLDRLADPTPHPDDSLYSPPEQP